MKGRSVWPALRWMSWANIDFPVPGSPTMSTDEGKLARVLASSTICLRPGLAVTRLTSRAHDSARVCDVGLAPATGDGVGIGSVVGKAPAGAIPCTTVREGRPLVIDAG